jgi:ATP/maltotriose-dependent transcriptional regulator MalT
MAAQTEPLVGRTDEMSLLDRLLDELEGRSSAAVELVGEPGIGKTRMLAELAARADAKRQLVLSGSASELERDLPFSVFVDALDEYLRSLQPARLESLDEDVRTELAHVFPSLTALATGREIALQHERYRSHRAVRALLEQLAHVQPLVLVLDDLHWADSASAELVAALLRRPPAEPVLLALAVRPRQVPERLSAALGRAHRSRLLTRIELGALSVEESRELLGDSVGGADADALYEESGGNPFYLEQLARSLDRASGPAVADDDASLASMGVPSSVAAALSEELALLSDPTRRALEGAAVAGDPFEPELAGAACEASEAAVMEAVDELLQVDLLRPTDAPRRFRFRHPLVRRAVYEATPVGWRLGAHERCAAALAARGASAAARAHHVERSAREGDLDTVAVLREAGEQSVRLAPASAAHWFGEALRLLPESATGHERVELLFARSGALTAVGRFEDSHGALLEALALVPEDAHALRARLERACAAVESLLGRHEEANARLAGSLESLPDQGSPQAVALMIDLAQNAIWRARYAEMQGSVERAVRAARALGDALLTAAALAGLALAESMRGRPDRAEAARSEADALVASLSDDELARHVQASALLGGVELYLDRYAEADAHANRALTVARSTGQGEHVLVLIQTIGAVSRQRGQLAEAAEILDGGIEAARVLGNTHALVWGLSSRSSTALRAGDVELALAAAQESVDLCRDAGGSFHSAEAAADLAAALLETGQPERSVELLLSAAGGEELSLIAGSPRCRYLEVLVRGRLALGDRAGARRAAGHAGDWASRVGLPMAAVWAGRAAAAVDLDAGDATRAAEQALTSASLADETGAPVEAALSRVVAGRALAEAGDGERAVAELQHAAGELEARGAMRYRDEAERELRKLGRHVYRRTRPGKHDGPGVESLTARELQLARLVVDRKTNPQIAAELFLSQKTVETHLRNIFRKVGVSSRVELARVVERADAGGGT